MKNEFDKNLTDKGWQSMRGLLDREMPEERRRRWFIWWWAALLLLPLAGAGLWLLSQPATPEKKTPRVTAPRISEPVVKTEGTSTPNFPKVPNFRKVEMHSATDLRSADRSTIVDSKTPEESHVKAYPSDESKPSDELNADKTSLKSPTFVKLDALEASELIQALSDVVKVPDEIVSSPHYEKITPLPVRLQLVENEDKNLLTMPQATAFQPETIKKQATPKHWSFGMTAGLASERFSKLNGFSAGAAVDWQFARKWGLRSGLQYAQYRLSDAERPVVTLDVNSYSEATDNYISFSGSPNNDPYFDPSVLVPVEQLKQLEMPVLAWWQPIRPLRIFGGFTTTYNLSAQASQQNYSNNQFYYANTKVAQDNLNELTSNTLSRWQMNWQVGAGIRIGRHFELDALYKQGFSKTTSAQFNSDPNSLFDQQWQPRSAGAAHYFLLNGIWFF